MSRDRSLPIQFTGDFIELLGRANVRWEWVLDTIAQPDRETRDGAVAHASRILPDGRELRVSYEDGDGGIVPLSVRLR